MQCNHAPAFVVPWSMGIEPPIIWADSHYLVKTTSRAIRLSSYRLGFRLIDLNTLSPRRSIRALFAMCCRFHTKVLLNAAYPRYRTESPSRISAVNFDMTARGENDKSSLRSRGHHFRIGRIPHDFVVPLNGSLSARTGNKSVDVQTRLRYPFALL